MLICIAREQFPILAPFETPWEIARWQGSAKYTVDGTVHLEGKYSLRVGSCTKLYSGVGLKYFPENWEGAESLRFGLYNPDQEVLYLTCRINDQKHIKGCQAYADRFNRQFAVPADWSPVEFDTNGRG